MPATGALTGFAPVVSADCRALVLGSFPGVASLAAGHYYAHPRNQFWPIVAHVLGFDGLADDFARRYDGLLAHGIGLWDVIARCERQGSLDQAIRASQPVPLPELMQTLPRLQWLLLNGRRAQRDVRRVLPGRLPVGQGGNPVTLVDLPSTSPAHASLNLDAKLALWRPALERTQT